MKQLNITTLAFIILFITSCSNDNENDMEETPILAEPSMNEIEVGYGNNGQGVIGRDFHLNAEVLAGELIDMVVVNIDQKEGESYSNEWSFSITWDEFNGLKNATVHKHFDIPEDAPEGNYSFTITVTDKNGTEIQEVYDFEIIDPANLPVDPYLYIWMITTDQGDFHYVNETLENPENVEFSNGEILKSDATINDVKGDGAMYLLLIKKSQEHLPETIEEIDFSKVIVYDFFEHTDQEEVDSFGNIIYDGQGGFLRATPELTIGATQDNNLPEPNTIDGEKAWESGDYYFGVIYTNTTYDMSIHHYFEVTISGF